MPDAIPDSTAPDSTGPDVAATSVAVTNRREQERSRVTRLRLMEAAVDCLVEYGWAGTTTTVVAERAGVSRGAQLHHYPTRAELVVAAVEHVGRALVDLMLDAAKDLPSGPQRTEAVLQLLGDFYSGPLFVAALELWVAARTDPKLREVVIPLERRVGWEAHRLTVGVLGLDDGDPEVREAVQGTLDMVRGMGLANLLTDDCARRRAVIRRWARILDSVTYAVATFQDVEDSSRPPTTPGVSAHPYT